MVPKRNAYLRDDMGVGEDVIPNLDIDVVKNMIKNAKKSAAVEGDAEGVETRMCTNPPPQGVEGVAAAPAVAGSP